MKILSFASIFLLLATSLPSSACVDPNARSVDAVELAERLSDSWSASRCLRKLKRIGFNFEQANAWITPRLDGDDGPITKSIVFQGPDRQGRRVRLKLEYDLRNYQYNCEKVSTSIPRGC